MSNNNVQFGLEYYLLISKEFNYKNINQNKNISTKWCSSNQNNESKPIYV